MKLTRIQTPERLLSFGDVTDFLRVTSDDQGVVEALIDAAVDEAEELTQRAFITQKWRLQFDDDFPNYTKRANGEEIRLPRPPLVSVDTFSYVDTDGVTQNLVEGTDFEVSTSGICGVLRPLPGKAWPATYGRYDDVTIDYTAGFGADCTLLPPGLLHTVKMRISELYENRQGMFMTPNLTVELPLMSSAVRFGLLRYRVEVLT